MIQLEPAGFPAPAPLPPITPPSSGTTTSWWLVSGSVMTFENISFSKPVAGSGPALKLLSCAECELGPIGWSVEGGTEYWVHAERVGYRV